MFDWKINKKYTAANNEHGKELAPNRFLQPLNYKKWEMMGNILDYHESAHIKDPQNKWKELFYRYSRSFAGVFGAVLFLVLVISAIFIPFATANPDTLDIDNKYLNFFEKSSVIFGTDYLGRDLFARLWWGLRYSLALALVTTIIQVFVGLLIGIMMGHFKIFDTIMTYIIKVISNVPSIIILIVITIVWRPTFWVMVFALTFTSWTGIANQMRSQVLRAKTFEWVSASGILGTPTYKILLNYLPVVIPLLVTEIVFHIPGVILSETSLAFIGLSIDIPTLGNLISEGSKVFTAYPRYVLLPSCMLVLLTTSIQLISASIQDSLLRQR
ncbi:ABC transporter permease [Mycoplasma zalophidermidis]|uniref:ABC transporter permease n=1 Tax=Mycoplasma zalophidermidis TaxID=398174 RepID=A0ABS6DQJ2_9MOLU|nr:ABC transporter permease [Mycoplasma zalophidermidis]MBU4689982.1 ABC transporter permease [Mycoplasma zalophidermidis]MBU4693279.1 ABC transporter permease [Mycoplasma zalophidermidis]MCR8966425.1 ABC transporter permease [Mycoplasma zalophidermidis]